MTRSGGCQCGALRFRLVGEVRGVHLCHCRMCQKAVGNAFAALAPVGDARLEWTRGERRLWRSSDHASRGFCATCGTPLTYESARGTALCVGAFDDPASLPPETQDGTEGRLPWTHGLDALPGGPTDMRDAAGAPLPIRSNQHPDRDTASWP